MVVVAAAGWDKKENMMERKAVWVGVWAALQTERMHCWGFSVGCR